MVEFEGKVTIRPPMRVEPGYEEEAVEPPVTITLNGVKGTIGLHDPSGTRRMFFNPNHSKEYSALFLGENKAGIMVIRDSRGRDSIRIDGAKGGIVIKDQENKHSFSLHSNVKQDVGNGEAKWVAGIWLGANVREGSGKPGLLVLRGHKGNDTIRLDGSSGDMILQNADCAEDFDISESTEIEPGTVMVIEQEGKLKECDIAYDKRVAGVISGGGNFKPGLVLDKRKSIENRKSISLMGKVYCKVDAQSAPIDVGDLLTTSSTKGHAMKAVDPVKAFGSVIGKALKPLEGGSRGMIPVLVALQ
jgi:hypothetical protein